MLIKQESDNNNDEGSEKEKEGGILPKPNKALFDSNSPIYKRDNPDQAGEVGKAVKIDKHVSFFIAFVM
jgi:hypothetical protein